jgi:hypothetical protein
MPSLPLGTRDRALEALVEERVVGETGKLVMTRAANPPPLLPLALDRGEDRPLQHGRRGQALGQELLRAAANHFARKQDVLGPEAAVDHDRNVRRALLHALDRGEPAGVGQHQVEQDRIEALLAEPLGGLAQPRHVGQLESAIPAEQLGGHPGVDRIVLDQQHLDRSVSHHLDLMTRRVPASRHKLIPTCAGSTIACRRHHGHSGLTNP